MIDSDGYLVNVYKYIYRHPIEVRLCDKAVTYLYSTLFYKYQASARSPIYLENIIPTHAFDSYEDLDELKWINTRFENHESDSISGGLQKTLFAFEKDRHDEVLRR